MLYFRDHHWLRVNGRSRISALIDTKKRRREDVFWNLHMEFVAGGAKWRRVREWQRPVFYLELSSIKAPEHSWKDFEHYNFWGEPKGDHFHDTWDWYYRGAGILDASYALHGPARNMDYSFGGEYVWRVVERDGRWFTIEMAGLAEGRSLSDLAKDLPVAVTSDGVEEAADPDETFWQNNSEFYLIEQVAFGEVTVRVPRNVRDPEAYAVARASALAGTGQPEHIEVTDHSLSPNARESISGDLFVRLHFNGFYEH